MPYSFTLLSVSLNIVTFVLYFSIAFSQGSISYASRPSFWLISSLKSLKFYYIPFLQTKGSCVSIAHLKQLLECHCLAPSHLQTLLHFLIQNACSYFKLSLLVKMAYGPFLLFNLLVVYLNIVEIKAPVVLWWKINQEYCRSREIRLQRNIIRLEISLWTNLVIVVVIW